MQVLTGSRRDITIMLWDEQIRKAEKRLADSKKCFEIYRDEDSRDWIAEGEKRLSELISLKNKAIQYMNDHNIQ